MSTAGRVEGREPIPPAELQRRAVAGSVWTGIHTIVYLPIAFAANAVIARSLGVASYGHLAFLTVAFGLAVPFANLGFANSVIQAGSREEAAGDRAAAGRLLGRSLGFHLLVEFPVLLLISFVLTRGKPAWEIAAVALAVVCTCLFSGGAISLTIESRTAAGAKLAMGVNVVLQASTVATAVVTQSAASVWAVRVLVPALALGANLALLDPERRRISLRPTLPRRLGRGFWSFAGFTWAASVVTLLVFSRSEIFILRAFHQTHALGVFALAFGLSQQITAPADALLLPLLPAVAGILSAWPERALPAFARAMRVSAVVCGGIAAAVVPPLVLAIPLIYGRAFESTSWLFIPFALVSLLQSANNPILAFVNARQRGGVRLAASSVALVVDVAAAVALIPPFGAWGAVGANVAGQLVALGWLAATEPLVRAGGLAGIGRLYLPLLVGSAGAAGGIAAGLAARSAFTFLGPFAACIAGACLYVAGIRASRSGITSGDRSAFVGGMPAAVRRQLGIILNPVTAPGPDA